MGKYNNILVAYDGSELSKKALHVAAALLERVHRRTADHRYRVAVPNLGGDGAMLDIGRIMEELKNHGQLLLDEAADQVKDRAFPVNTVLLHGHPSTEIIDYAEQEKVDLIVMGNRGLNGVQRLFLGSVSHRVVQEAPCDVLVVHNA